MDIIKCLDKHISGFFSVLEISRTADERLMAYLMLDVTALMLGGSLEALMAGSGFWSPHA